LARLEVQSRRQYETLLAAIDRRSTYTFVQVGTLQLPSPDPARHVGWPAAVLDTTLAESLQSPRVASASQIFAEIGDANSLASLALAGKVHIDYLRLVTPDPNVQKGGVAPRYATIFQLRNLTNKEVTVAIPRGQVFENTTINSRYQNVVAAEETTITLAPNGVVPIRLAAYCLNRSMRAPIGGTGNVTPLKIRFEFKDQEELWNGVQREREVKP
jgi:hypothetical protein